VDDLGRLLASTSEMAGTWTLGVVTAVVSSTVVKVKVAPATTGTSAVKSAQYSAPAVGHLVVVLTAGSSRVVLCNIG